MLRVVIISDCNVKSMENMKDYILSQLSTLNMHTDKHVVMHFFNIFHRFALQNLNELVQSEIKVLVNIKKKRNVIQNSLFRANGSRPTFVNGKSLPR